MGYQREEEARFGIVPEEKKESKTKTGLPESKKLHSITIKM
jgi:hypothetical protein